MTDRLEARPHSTIAPDSPVRLHLEIRLEDGSVALSTFDGDPIACRIGDGTLAPGLESMLLGLAPGTDTCLIAHGSELFSPHDPSNLHWMERDLFPPGLDPLPGQVIAFSTPAGHETSGTVVARDGERVRVDFNHPFSTRSLTIRVQVLSP